jgi:hypothetical protein
MRPEDVVARPPGARGADASGGRQKEDQARPADILVELCAQILDPVQIGDRPLFRRTTCDESGRDDDERQ